MKSTKHPTEKLGRQPKSSKKLSFSAIKKLPQEGIAFIRGLGRNTKLALILVLVLVVVGIVVGLFGSNNQDETSFSETIPEDITEEIKLFATLTITEGTVESKNQEGDWEVASIDDEFTEGNDIRTVGATARAALEFENGSVLRIDANSEVLLETVNEERIVIKQTDGYTFSRVSKTDSAAYVVKSTDAQYEATGTAFQVITNGDEQAVEVYENTVVETVTNQEVKEGKKLTVKSRVKPTDNGRISSLDIETVKNNSFIAWNRSLDAENEAFKNNLGFLSDITPPEITITSPADNATVLLEPNASNGTVEFTGKTEPNSSLSILSKSSSGATPVSVSLGNNGEFTSPVIQAPLGSSVFEFTAVDKTGNKTVKNIRVTFQRKSAPIVAGGIVLSVDEKGDKLQANWSYSGLFKPVDGVRIVYGTSQSPVYDDDSSVYQANGNSATIDLSKLSEDTTYYLRACSYDKKKDTCSDYSNEETFKTPE